MEYTQKNIYLAALCNFDLAAKDLIRKDSFKGKKKL